MSKVTKENIKKISRLARIEVSDIESEAITSHLGKIIGWFEKLNEVNTDKVEPLVNVHEMTLDMKQDEVTDGDIAQDVLKNAKDAKYGYFAVPKVIE